MVAGNPSPGTGVEGTLLVTSPPVKLGSCLGISLLSAVACSKSGATPPTRAPVGIETPHAAAPQAAPRDAFSGRRFALVPAGTFGPYVGDRAEGTIAAWAALANGKRKWFTAPLTGPDAAHGEPKIVADAAPEVDLVAVKALGGASKGFVLVTSSREFSGSRVDVLALGPSGELRGGPSPLAQSLGDVVWVDAIPTATGALAMWAVRTEDRAQLFAVELGPTGEAKSEPSPLLTNARSWQATATPDGVAIAVVEAGKSRKDPGPIRVYFADAEGRLSKKSVTVSDGATAEPDLDFTKIGDHLVLAWTDDHGLEPRIYGAVVDAATGAVVKQPAPLGRPFGPQAMLRIVPGATPGDSAFLAVENAIEKPAGGRAIRIAALGGDGTVGDASALVRMAKVDGTIPEFASTNRGVAAFTYAPACKAGAACASMDPVPAFVEFDAALGLVASEPLRIGDHSGVFADQAWGLTCHASGCLGLADVLETPAPVFALALGSLGGAYRPAARSVAASPKPRADQVAAISKTDSIADLSTARVGDETLIASVSYFDPATPFTRSNKAAPDGKYEPIRGVVRVQPVADKGEPGDPVILSYRAQSQGGVSVVAGDPARGDALVAWVGIDNKQPEVFVTLVGPDGKKRAQKMLTHSKGGVSDVAATYTGDAFVVAWIDERSGASQVYLTKVDATLKPVVPERALGAGASTATGVKLCTRGDHVIAVWSDARGPASGVADIFAQRIASKDLVPIGPERPVATTPAHSESPSIAPFADGAVVTWIEDAPPGAEDQPGSLMVAELDSGGEPSPDSIGAVPLTGSPEGVGISCGQAACRIVAAVTDGDVGGLDAFVWKPTGDLRAERLVQLLARPRDAVAPEPVGLDVFYADESGSDAWLRRMAVTWE